MKKLIPLLVLLVIIIAGGSWWYFGSRSSSNTDGVQSPAPMNANLADPGIARLPEGMGADSGVTMVNVTHQDPLILEVPSFTNPTANPVIASLNQKILDFVGDYEGYIGDTAGISWLELKTYPLKADSIISIVTTKITYPNYATQGEIVSFIYDEMTGLELTLDQALTQDMISVSQPEAALTAAVASEYDGAQLVSATPEAFAATSRGNIYFYDVVASIGTDGDTMQVIFTRDVDGTYLAYDNEVLDLGTATRHLLPLLPPLNHTKVTNPAPTDATPDATLEL